MAEIEAEEVEVGDEDEQQSTIIPAWEDKGNGKVLCQIEYYRETKVRSRTALRAWERFQKRMNVLESELPFWRSIAFDSATLAELAARKLNQYKINPKSREPRQWFAGSTDALEEMMMMTLSALDCNVIVCAHIAEKTVMTHGIEALAPNLPGRLKKNIGAAFPEFYHMEVVEEEKTGGKVYQLQTQRDPQFNCTTQIGAPDPCEPSFKELWVNWTGERFPLHVFCYSDWGGGKSTFAATFPKPLLVLMWDPVGKDAPYRRLGRAVDVGVDQFGTPVTRIYGPVSAPGRKIKPKPIAA